MVHTVAKQCVLVHLSNTICNAVADSVPDPLTPMMTVESGGETCVDESMCAAGLAADVHVCGVPESIASPYILCTNIPQVSNACNSTRSATPYDVTNSLWKVGEVGMLKAAKFHFSVLIRRGRCGQRTQYNAAVRAESQLITSLLAARTLLPPDHAISAAIDTSARTSEVHGLYSDCIRLHRKLGDIRWRGEAWGLGLVGSFVVTWYQRMASSNQGRQRSRRVAWRRGT